MRQPTRAPKCWHLPTILHARQLTSTTYCHSPLTQPNRNTILTSTQTLALPTKLLLIKPSSKPSPPTSFHSQSPPIWPSPMTPQSPCRSPHCRIHATSSPTPKTRRLRHYTSYNPSKPFIKQPTLSLHYLSPMRSTNNQRHLPTPNRPKITNCLLICQPHRSSSSCNHNPNPMSILRGNNPNNLPRPDLLNTILPSQHQLRTNSQPNPSTHTRNPTPPTTHSHLMTTSQPNKHSPAPNNKPHSRAYHRNRTL